MTRRPPSLLRATVAAVVIVLVSAAAAIAAVELFMPAAPRPTPVVTPQPTAGPDLGSGTPGAGCATSRLGKTFYQDGRLYQCSGPKPYRWRPVPMPSGGAR